MKNLTLSFSRLAIVLTSALSLGACSRAQYATTSQAADSPLGASIATLPPAATTQTVPYVAAATTESAVVKAPAASSPAPVAATQPAQPVTTEVASSASVVPAVAAVTGVPATKPAAKLHLVQRLALHKITKKLDKLVAQAPQLKNHDATAARGGLDSNLRSALLFGLIGIILLLFTGVNNIFGVLGTISLIIGLVFLVLWLLDQA